MSAKVRLECGNVINTAGVWLSHTGMKRRHSSQGSPRYAKHCNAPISQLCSQLSIRMMSVVETELEMVYQKERGN